MKRTRRVFFIVFFCLFASITAFPSEEFPLSLDTFQLSSEIKELKKAGREKVFIRGTRNKDGQLETMTVHVFGNVHVLSNEIIKHINQGGFNFSGINLSSEGGWESIGGRVLYITFLNETTHIDQIKKVLSINQEGLSEVSSR